MELDTTNLDLHPSTIDLSTFQHLLTLYDETVQRVAAAKALKKPSSKGESQSQGRKDKKGKKRAAPSGEDGEDEEVNGDGDGEGNGEVEELSPDQKNMVNEAIRQYRDLDDWRYGVLPGLLEERREMEGEGEGEDDEDSEEQGKKKGKGKGKDKISALCLSKDEAMKLLEWKLKHGLPRPFLLGLLRSNKENVIQSATRDAFASLSLPTGSSSPSAKYSSLQSTLQKLTTPLRGIGPATASLILSTADPEGVPFYSDDIYLWLCLGIYPGFDPSTPWIFNEDEEKEGKRANNPTPKQISQDKTKQEKSASNLRRPKHERDAALRAKQVRPNGELNVKYDFSEYRRVWGAVRCLRERINEEARENGKERISCVDVEKVALVVRYLRGKKGELVVVEKVKKDKKEEKRKGMEKKETGRGKTGKKGGKYEGDNAGEDEECDFAGMNEERRKRLKRGGRNN